MKSPICKKWFNTQDAGKPAMFNIVPDQDTILAMHHHNCLMEAKPVCFIGKLGRITQTKFLEKMFLPGVKDTGVLTA
jgi:hypothetical protein